MEPVDGRQFRPRQWNAGLRDDIIQTFPERGDAALVDRRTFDVRDDAIERRGAPGIDVVRYGTAKQHRQVFHPGAREREDGLEQQVEEQVVAPHVDDVDDVGPDCRNVRKVLVRADADIDAAPHATLLQIGDDLEIRALVRNEVVGVEVTRRLRQRGDFGGKRRLLFCARAASKRPPRQREAERSQSQSRAGDV